MSASTAIRVATPEDLNFVRASWFESYRLGGSAPQVAFPIYRHGQNLIIERLIARSKILIAYATSVPDEICAWGAAEPELIHYIYTKHGYRKLGFATHIAELLRPYATHTHETRVGRSLAAKLGTKYNPYNLYKGV